MSDIKTPIYFIQVSFIHILVMPISILAAASQRDTSWPIQNQHSLTIVIIHPNNHNELDIFFVMTSLATGPFTYRAFDMKFLIRSFFRLWLLGPFDPFLFSLFIQIQHFWRR